MLKLNIETFLPIAILLASKKGCDIEIEEPMEDGYFANLALGLSPFVYALYGGYQPKLLRRGARLTAASPRAGRSALLFSCGIDSFYSLRRLLDANIHIDYLINIHAGAHDDNKRTWEVRLTNIAAVSSEVGIPVIEIDTNFHVL